MPSPVARDRDQNVQFGGVRVALRRVCGPAETPRIPNDENGCFRVSYFSPERAGKADGDRQAPRALSSCLPQPRLFLLAPGVALTTPLWGMEQGLAAHFQFHPSLLADAAALLRANPQALYQSVLQELAVDGCLDALCCLLVREVEEGCQHGPAYFEAMTRALALALVRRVTPARAGRRRDPRIERAARLIEQKFREKAVVEEAARAAGLSRSHFSRAFYAATGVLPHEYLIQCRLRHARRLIALNGGRRSLAEIATDAGFSDQAHMTRHFRRAFGQTPACWQRAQ